LFFGTLQTTWEISSVLLVHISCGGYNFDKWSSATWKGENRQWLIPGPHTVQTEFYLCPTPILFVL
jgi:hypothetical protein